MASEALATLARLYLQTLGLSLLFVGTGCFVQRALFPGPRATPSLQWARGYFVGISAFLPVYVFLSRMTGAHLALWIALAAMGALSLREAIASARAGVARGTPWGMCAALLGLIALYSLTNTALWLSGLPPPAEPALLNHFGSIHAGRYANYAVFIAEHDRIPFLAQNGAQSMLASIHLLLGVESPLAALMVWLPFSLAFLTCLFHGLFRAQGFSRGSCAAATFLVMFCNVAVSAIHLLLFDNGSPLAFIGYTDMAIAVATFVLFCMWLGERLASDTPAKRRQLVFPALLGLTWAWYAPQNIVIAGAACAAAAWRREGRSFALRRGLVMPAAAFVLAVAFGATQFGSFLPGSLREDTGFWVQDVKPTLAIRPYIQYLRNHWTAPRWKEPEPGVYENAYGQSRPIGPDEAFRTLEWLAEENLWDSVRIYGFPLLGLAMLFAWLRRRPVEATHTHWPIWWSMSAGSFAAGYLICYLLELGQMKWWLTRFLVPGTAMALTCLGFALAAGASELRPRARRSIWALLLVAATFGPLVELATVAFRNFVATAHSDPIAARLELLALRKGPLVFETLEFRAESASRDARGFFAVGGESRQQGLAVHTRAMPMPPGQRRVAFRLDSINPPAGDAPLLEVDVVDAANHVIATRLFARRDLERRPDGYWAMLDFALSREVPGARIRLWNRSDAAFRVTAMRLEPR